MVEGINIPDHSLSEHTMLVESDELPKCFRRQLLGDNRIRGAIPCKRSVWHEPVRDALCPRLFRRLSESHRLRVREDICQEQFVMASLWIDRPRERNKVTGHQPCPLMHQLVK